MKKLNNYELNEINGGGRILFRLLGIGVTFLFGMFKGFMTPQSCK